VERTGGTWTDERLDDLARRVDDGFSRIDADIRSLRTEVSGRFDSLDARLDSLQRTMIQFMGGITIAVLATLASVIATQA
jgi:hypothetical protein